MNHISFELFSLVNNNLYCHSLNEVTFDSCSSFQRNKNERFFLCKDASIKMFHECCFCECSLLTNFSITSSVTFQRLYFIGKNDNSFNSRIYR